jgi:aerobic-type carbon monoxide dehydrogenase small subunit (CoxS/CutS family)
MRVGFLLNGERFVIDVPPGTSLLEVLRGEFGVKSIHTGCQSGHCGACLVLFNDTAVPACLVPVFSCRDGHVETVESITTRSDFADIEKGFQKTGLVPCSLCASAKIILTESLLRGTPEPDSRIIEASLPADWCPCGSRDQYVDAILASLELRRKRKKHVSGA